MLAHRLKTVDNGYVSEDGEIDESINEKDEVLKAFPNAGKFLKSLISFGKVTQEQKDMAGNFDLKLYSWDEFLLLGMQEKNDLPAKKKTDICTIMYTSGTTGDPKGVMISNESILSLISGVNHHMETAGEEFTDKDVYLSYLPLAHIFDRVIEELFISKGASVGFWHKDIKQLIDDIKEQKPTVFCSVPRVLDRIYSGESQKLTELHRVLHGLNVRHSTKIVLR